MSMNAQCEIVHKVIQGNRYLTLATSLDGFPWIAPLEYIVDQDLNFYFFSLISSRHARHLSKNECVAVTVFDAVQDEYTPGLSVILRGVQIEGKAWLLPKEDYPPSIVAAIDALRPPMPPYAVFKIEPQRFYLPTIEKGINNRVEVDMHR